MNPKFLENNSTTNGVFLGTYTCFYGFLSAQSKASLRVFDCLGKQRSEKRFHFRAWDGGDGRLADWQTGRLASRLWLVSMFPFDDDLGLGPGPGPGPGLG
ncbi:hypothetical protein ACMFMF_000974 [Clarireedia jacksonii]